MYVRKAERASTRWEIKESFGLGVELENDFRLLLRIWSLGAHTRRLFGF
jgi:hypothetical protein